MKIWYLSAYDQPKGQATRTYDFSKELVLKGHDVTFFTNSYCHFTHKNTISFDGSYHTTIVDGIKVVWLNSNSYKGNGLARGLNMIINAYRILSSSSFLSPPDIILGPSVPISTGWAAYMLSKRYKVPFIFEIRDVWPDILVDIGGISKINPIYHIFKFMEKKLYKKSSFISSSLPFVSEHIKRCGADPSKVVYIPNGINVDAHECEKGENNKRSKNTLTAMYIGGFSLDHDVLTILKSAKILQEEGVGSIKFIIVGDGVTKKECLTYAREHNINNVEFRDTVPKTQFFSLQKEGDVLIASITDSPSYRFGLNLNKICTYLAAGKPILFSGNSPNNQVKESGAGISVTAESPEEMVAALKDFIRMSPEEIKTMGEKGKKYAKENLSMQILGARMEKMLIKAVSNYKHP